MLFDQVLWDALPEHLRQLDRALLEATGQGLPLDAAPIRFGSWMGGDRDGNPNVTAAVTEEVCLLARWQAADLYLREVERLHDELSMTRASDELAARVGDAAEPYRALLKEVLARLHATRETCESGLRVLHGKGAAAGAPARGPPAAGRGRPDRPALHRSPRAVGAAGALLPVAARDRRRAPSPTGGCWTSCAGWRPSGCR